MHAYFNVDRSLCEGMAEFNKFSLKKQKTTAKVIKILSVAKLWQNSDLIYYTANFSVK